MMTNVLRWCPWQRKVLQCWRTTMMTNRYNDDEQVVKDAKSSNGDVDEFECDVTDVGKIQRQIVFWRRRRDVIARQRCVLHRCYAATVIRIICPRKLLKKLIILAAETTGSSCWRLHNIITWLICQHIRCLFDSATYVTPAMAHTVHNCGAH